MRVLRAFAFAAAQLVVSSSLLLSARPALADPQPTEQAMAEARSRYARGIQLAEDGAFDQAQVELERAYQLWPSYKILYNLGLTKRELGDNVGALTAFEKYLAEGGAEIAPARRTEVENLIAKLKTRVGSLSIKVSVPGAEVLVDGVSIGRAPLDKAVLVNAGRRKVTAIGPLGPVSKLVDVGGQETEDVSFDLPVAPPPDRPRDQPPPSRVAAPASSGSNTPMWIGWSATGALATGAIITGIVGLGASSSLTDAKNAPDPSPDRLSTLSSRAKAFALVSDVLTGAAIVAGGVSIYLTLRHPSPTTKTGWVRVQVQGLGMNLQAGF